MTRHRGIGLRKFVLGLLRLALTMTRGIARFKKLDTAISVFQPNPSLLNGGCNPNVRIFELKPSKAPYRSCGQQ